MINAIRNKLQSISGGGLVASNNGGYIGVEGDITFPTRQANMAVGYDTGVGAGPYLTLLPQTQVIGDNTPVDWFPRAGAEHYPMDLDASQRYTRPRGPAGIHPWPTSTGYLNSFLPMLTDLAVQIAFAKKPAGPWIGGYPAAGVTGGQYPLVPTNGLTQVSG